MSRILISDKAHPILEEKLTQAGHRVDVLPNLSYAELLSAAKDYQVLVVRSKVDIDKQFIDSVPSLRIIARLGAGMETIDTDYAATHNITCLNSPEGNRTAVGEHTVGMILSLLNNIARADAEVRKGMWRREANRGKELGSRTVGLIGLGNMGTETARCLSAFGCTTLAYDKHIPSSYAPYGVHRVSLSELKQQADIISLHVPLTPHTHHLVNTEFIDSVSQPFYLINTSRGAVVDTDALPPAIESGKLLGAALDVLEFENMNDDALSKNSPSLHYLQQSPHTVLTPHVAGWTVESKYKLASTLADKIIASLNSTL